MINRLGSIISKNDVSLTNFRTDNINGPSVIKVPDWIENPLGKYYLYFAHHKGKQIRLAYSDNIEGPFTIHNDGVLNVNQTLGHDHIASPDVHIDNDNKKIIMYYHTPFSDWQYTFKSYSDTGLSFVSDNKPLGMFYFRVFKFDNRTFAIAKNRNTSGITYELIGDSEHQIDNEWIVQDENFIPNMRHCAVLTYNNKVFVFYSVIGEEQESIYCSEVNVNTWEIIQTKLVLKPECDYEGVNLPKFKSTPGSVNYDVNQLRDPCIYQEDSKVYLLYSYAGESGIAIGEIDELERL
jgi:hypothetical protein